MENIAFIDVEVSFNKVKDIGALRKSNEFHSSSLNDFLSFISGVEYLCGHNIIDHDLVNLKKHTKYIDGFKYIDTLYLSPLLFPKKPYHKLLKDDKFNDKQDNNPLNDSIKAKNLFYDEVMQFNKLDEDLKVIYYNLLNDNIYFKNFFEIIGYKNKINNLELFIKEKFYGSICKNSNVKGVINKYPVELAYAIAQIHVMGFDNSSLTPAWVLKKFPIVENILRLFRGASCNNCSYCNDKLDVVKGLQYWFGYKAFRKFDGEDLQERASRHAIDGDSLLAVFPTGGGKSITFQLPALMQGRNEKGLTVVISPLQSLQKDQIDNLEEKHGITDAVRIDGSLDPIERSKQILRVEEGGASLLYISPESLRSKTVEKILTKRNIVRFVIDEAHCFSSWGQDFRTDYLYVAEFIKKLQKNKGNKFNIPVSCFTATAKQEVIDDIIKYFKYNLNLDLKKIISSSGRSNLIYNAIHLKDEVEKNEKLRMLLSEYNCPTIIYVTRTKRAEELANKLIEDGFDAIYYHGKMDKQDRVHSQESFIKGVKNIIVATKAFGMGVDKDDVGLVVHYEISTSLEDYIQEAGRAARDINMTAACYALFNDDDINKHFAFLSQTKINQNEIGQIWTAIKKLTNKRSKITASALDIAREAGWDDKNEGEIRTRVLTSINALEQVAFIKRGQNSPRIYATSLLVKSTMEASEKIQNSSIFEGDKEKNEAVRIVQRLFKTISKGGMDGDENNEHVDYIADKERLNTDRVVKIIQKLREEKILADSMDLHGSLQKDNGNWAKRNLDTHSEVEKFLIRHLSEREGLFKGRESFNIKELNYLMMESYPNTSIAHLNKILNFYHISRIIARKKDYNPDYIFLKPHLSAIEIEKRCNKRILLSNFIIRHLYNKKSKDDKIEFSVLEIVNAFNHEHVLLNESVDSLEVQDALYYLKRIKSLEIDGGFLVIYNRISIDRLEDNNSARYTKEHYKKLDEFYESKREQIHIVAEYLRLLSTDYEKALEFTHDYFIMRYDMFRQKYFKGRLGELSLNMTVAKHDQIFKHLSSTQKQVVDNYRNRYIVVGAGPGSGKTTLLTHKLAAIFLQEDIKHEQILMLTFSRAAANEFKVRLLKLIGNAANFVKIKTFHSYCFDILGKLGTIEQSQDIISEAINKIQLKEVDDVKLTNAIIVIDESQDMSEAEYKLVKVLMNHNEGMKVVAVGDDDQNIYEWRGSSSLYMQEFLKEENSIKYELVENFRSVKNIVAFSESFAKNITSRFKERPMISYKKDNGKISVCKLISNNIEIPIVEKVIEESLSGSTCIIVRTNEQALNIVGMLTNRGIKSKIIQTNNNFDLFDLVEVREFYAIVTKGKNSMIDQDDWNDGKNYLIKKYTSSPNLDIIKNLIRSFEKLNLKYKYKSDFKEFIDESKLHDFIEQDNTILVSTIHQTKGREFDNVYLALDKYHKMTDEVYRQIYVAITRAKNNLHISYIGSYFDNINVENLIRYKDYKNYDKPNRIRYSLTHRDVYLHSFNLYQKEISSLISGQELSCKNEGMLNAGKYVLKYSKRFKDMMSDLKKRGYVPVNAWVDYIVYWRPSDEESSNKKEIKILLPSIEFIRD